MHKPVRKPVYENKKRKRDFAAGKRSAYTSQLYRQKWSGFLREFIVQMKMAENGRVLPQSGCGAAPVYIWVVQPQDVSKDIAIYYIPSILCSDWLVHTFA